MRGEAPTAPTCHRSRCCKADQVGEFLCKIELGFARAVHGPVAALTEGCQVPDVSSLARVQPHGNDMLSMKLTTTALTLLARVVVELMHSGGMLCGPSPDRLAV